MKKIFKNIMALAVMAVSFAACEDVPEPYNVFGGNSTSSESVEGHGTGTLSDPFDAVAATNEAKKLANGEVSEKDYYIKGIVVSIATDKSGVAQNYDNGTFGNGSFYISSDGTSTNQFYIYRAMYLGNKKWTKGSGDVVKVGDEVIVCGKLTMYGSTPETAANQAYLYSLNGKSEGGGGDDTPATDVKKVTVAEFNAAPESETVWYQLTGTVKNLKDGDIYGNFDLDDGTGSVYVFGLLSEKGGEKKKFQELVAAKGIKNGSKLTLIGTRGSYNDKIEVLNAYFVSIEGGSTPTPQPTNDVGSIDAPKSVAEALAAANALGNNETSSAYYYIIGKVTRKANTANEIGPNSEKKYKDMNYYISADGTQNNELYVYRGKFLDGADFTDYEQLKEGDEVVIYGQLQKYIDANNGNAVVPEVKGSKIVKLNGQSGGGDTPQPGNTGGSLEGNVLTVVCGDLGISEIQTVTLVDGTQISFSQNDGKSAPIYHVNSAEFRIYARNSLNIKTVGKTIQSVVFTYTFNNGAACYGNPEMYGRTGAGMDVSPERDETANTITFMNIGSGDFTVNNALSEKNSGGVQFRFSKVVITYSE